MSDKKGEWNVKSRVAMDHVRGLAPMTKQDEIAKLWLNLQNAKDYETVYRLLDEAIDGGTINPIRYICAKLARLLSRVIY